MSSMHLKLKTAAFAAVRIFMCALLFFFAFSSGVLWISISLGTVAVITVAAELYYHFHYVHSSRRERHRIESQRPLRRYNYDRWYTPADSTKQNELVDELRKTKKKIRR
jgi:hypothetical protein